MDLFESLCFFFLQVQEKTRVEEGRDEREIAYSFCAVFLFITADPVWALRIFADPPFFKEQNNF